MTAGLQTQRVQHGAEARPAGEEEGVELPDRDTQHYQNVYPALKKYWSTGHVCEIQVRVFSRAGVRGTLSYSMLEATGRTLPALKWSIWLANAHRMLHSLTNLNSRPWCSKHTERSFGFQSKFPSSAVEIENSDRNPKLSLMCFERLPYISPKDLPFDKSAIVFWILRGLRFLHLLPHQGERFCSCVCCDCLNSDFLTGQKLKVEESIKVSCR